MTNPVFPGSHPTPKTGDKKKFMLLSRELQPSGRAMIQETWVEPGAERKKRPFKFGGWEKRVRPRGPGRESQPLCLRTRSFDGVSPRNEDPAPNNPPNPDELGRGIFGARKGGEADSSTIRNGWFHGGKEASKLALNGAHRPTRVPNPRPSYLLRAFSPAGQQRS